MRNFRREALCLAACAVVAGLTLTAARASDWPQWRGPERNGVSRETSLLKSWPAGGPRALWSVKTVGGGYGTPSVANGRVYGLGYRNNSEVVWALDAASGREVWATPIARANRRDKGYNDGSRSTPTVDGSRLYAVGDSGDFVCLDAGSGRLLWKKDLVADFGGNVPGWGYVESPLVDGQKVIVTPGGGQATLVALNKENGAVLWKARVPEGNDAHYASAIVATVDGVRQVIQFLGGGLVGVSADNGRFLWRYDRHAGVTANIATPVLAGNSVFVAAAYGSGGGLVRLAKNGAGISAREVYFTSDLKNKHGGMVLVGNTLFGFDDPRPLVCMDIKTGRVLWSNQSVGGNASVLYADGHLYVRSQRGTMALVEASAKSYVEKGRFEPRERSGKETWAHPVVANGRLYLRDQNMLTCYDVRGR